jgi:hypothetical protein
MSFLLGFFMGVVASFVFLASALYLLVTRPNNMAVAKFINGIALALAHKRPKPSAPAEPCKNGEATEQPEEPANQA